MSRTFPSLVEVAPLRAVLLREFRDALINRYFQVFSVLSLLGGAAAFVMSEDAHSIAFLILQVSLYFVSLFALLAGMSLVEAALVATLGGDRATAATRARAQSRHEPILPDRAHARR